MQELKYIDIFKEGFPYFIADTVFENTFPTQAHTHDFHEFFLLKQGELFHIQNGNSQRLKKGDLCFVNADDVHYFQPTKNDNPTVITNVAFQAIEMSRSMEYLSGRKLISRKVEMDDQQLQTLLFLFDSIYQTNHANLLEDLLLSFRSLLTLVLGYFLTDRAMIGEDEIPRWLVDACELMQKAENFSQGIPRFTELSGKTQEHLTRSLKKHHKLTPSEFINKLRLDEAAKQIRISLKPVSEIGYEVGFENPSYFNRLFKQVYGLSPNQYRKANHSIVYFGG